MDNTKNDNAETVRSTVWLGELEAALAHLINAERALSEKPAGDLIADLVVIKEQLGDIVDEERRRSPSAAVSDAAAKPKETL